MSEEEEIRQIKARDLEAGQVGPLSHAMLAEFPCKPYALFPAGGYVGAEGHDFLIHKEISNEEQCVLLFESIVDADMVITEYKSATGEDAEPRRLEARGIEERFWVKFYRADGTIVMGPIVAYWERMGLQDDYQN